MFVTPALLEADVLGFQIQAQTGQFRNLVRICHKKIKNDWGDTTIP